MTSFFQAFPPTPCAHLYPSPYAPHVLPISFVSILPPAQYCVRVQIIQLLVMQLSPFPCHLVPLRSKYFPHHVLCASSSISKYNLYHLESLLSPIINIRGWYGDRIPVEARFFALVQTGPGAHPASCTMGTGSFPGVKSGRGVTLTPHLLLVPLVMKE